MCERARPADLRIALGRCHSAPLLLHHLQQAGGAFEAATVQPLHRCTADHCTRCERCTGAREGNLRALERILNHCASQVPAARSKWLLLLLSLLCLRHRTIGRCSSCSSGAQVNGGGGGYSLMEHLQGALKNERPNALAAHSAMASVLLHAIAAAAAFLLTRLISFMASNCLRPTRNKCLFLNL